VQKHISAEGDRVAGVSLHAIKWPASSLFETTTPFWPVTTREQRRIYSVNYFILLEIFISWLTGRLLWLAIIVTFGRRL